jgi:hypothetical protein
MATWRICSRTGVHGPVKDNSQLLLDPRLSGDLDSLQEFAHELSQLGQPLGQSTVAGRGTSIFGHVNADPENIEQGLAKLVLTLIELLRRLLEMQAIRRMEAGSLTDAEIERMGETFLKLERKMVELKEVFGLQDESLNLNLGPLGNLMPDE